jgi:hypothetical protein
VQRDRPTSYKRRARRRKKSKNPRLFQRKNKIGGGPRPYSPPLRRTHVHRALSVCVCARAVLVSVCGRVRVCCVSVRTWACRGTSYGQCRVCVLLSFGSHGVSAHVCVHAQCVCRGGRACGAVCFLSAAQCVLHACEHHGASVCYSAISVSVSLT